MQYYTVYVVDNYKKNKRIIAFVLMNKGNSIFNQIINLFFTNHTFYEFQNKKLTKYIVCQKMITAETFHLYCFTMSVPRNDKNGSFHLKNWF